MSKFISVLHRLEIECHALRDKLDTCPAKQDWVFKLSIKFRLPTPWKKGLSGFQSPDDAGASIL